MFRAETFVWNRTETDYPRDKTVAQLFDEQAARTPSAIAVISGEKKLTYAELYDRSNRLARLLQDRGAGPDTLIGLAIERSNEMIVALLAILKAGAAYVSLDPGYPSERTALVMEDARAPLLLTTENTRGRLPQGVSHLISLDGDAASIAAQSSGRISSLANASNLAYVIYTSGSTGKPKGVMIEHRNVVNFFAGMDRVIGPAPGVWLAVTSVSFDISVLELLWTLARGFTVVIHGDEGTHTIASEIARHHVTHLQSTPSLARMLTLDPRALSALGSLQKFMLGGEALPSSLIAALLPVIRGEIFNMYGPTETTIWSTTYRIQEPSTVIPIGKPIANTQVYVLDSRLQPVPQGEPGDLFIGGDGVVRGYWNRPELTAERFLPDPFRDAARMYRTGDIARFLPTGDLEFLGRSDFQVKIRGFRIELGEIEALLEQQSSVRQAVVIAREDRPGDKRLAAYVVRAEDGGDVAASLRAVLEAKLPDYMVPSHIVFLDALPLTANGKIDRNTLPAPPQHTSRGVTQHPQSELERIITKVWADALGMDQVGLNENFFDLGAHSLMVPEVQIELQRLLDRDIPLLDLFEFPTVSALARHLAGNQAERPVSDRAQRRRAAQSRRSRA